MVSIKGVEKSCNPVKKVVVNFKAAVGKKDQAIMSLHFNKRAVVYLVVTFHRAVELHIISVIDFNKKLV